MKVINEVKMRGCDQWLAGFVKRIFKKAKVNCNEIVINSFDGRVVGLKVDNDYEAYKVLINGMRDVVLDDSKLPCEGKMAYVLFELKKGEYTAVLIGSYKVKWKNRFEEIFPKEAVKTIVLEVLNSMEKDEEDIEAYCCVDNCIAVLTKDAAYRICIWEFPAFAYDKNGHPVGYQVGYSWGEIMLSEEDNQKLEAKLVGHGQCELMALDPVFYEQLKSKTN